MPHDEFTELLLEATMHGADDWAEKGRSLLAAKQYAEALDAFQKAIDIDEEHADAWEGRSRCHFHLGDFERAKRANHRALELEPKNPKAWVAYGAVAYHDGDFVQAQEAIDHALELCPACDRAWFNKGVLLAEQDDIDEAIDAVEQAISYAPRNVEYLCAKGQLLIEAGRNADAIEPFDTAIELELDCADAWGGKGDALYNLKRYDEAFTYYWRAAHLDPDPTLAWLKVGNTCERMGRAEQELSAYDRALKSDRDCFDAWIAKAELLDQLKRHDEALKALDEALRLNPESVAAWQKKGDALFNLAPSELDGKQEKTLEHALAAYDAALRLDESSEYAWFMRAMTLQKLGKRAAARQSFQKVLEATPQNAKDWVRHATTNVRLGQPRKALEAAQNALPHRSGLSTGWLTNLHLARCYGYRSLGSSEKALEAAEKALEVDSDNATAWLFKAYALKELEDYRGAMDAVDQCIALQRARGGAWTLKALLHVESGLYMKALQLLEDTAVRIPEVQSSPDFWEAKGGAQIGVDQPEHAIGSFRRGIALDPGEPLLWKNLGFACAKAGRVVAARQALLRAGYLLERGDAVVIPSGAKKGWMTIIQVLDALESAPLFVLPHALRASIYSNGLREPAILASARRGAAPYLQLRDYFDTERTTLSAPEQHLALGLGALALGDPFRALEHFDSLDDICDEREMISVVVQYYLARCHLAFADFSIADAPLEEGRDLADKHLDPILWQDFSEKEVSDDDLERLYYAGQVFLLSAELSGRAPGGENQIGGGAQRAGATEAHEVESYIMKARQYFERCARLGFLPARYMLVYVLALFQETAQGDPDALESAIETLIDAERALSKRGRGGFLSGYAHGFVDLPSDDLVTSSGNGSDEAPGAELSSQEVLRQNVRRSETPGEQGSRNVSDVGTKAWRRLWAVPFRKQAYYNEIRPALPIVYDWLASREGPSGQLPAHLTFIDRHAFNAVSDPLSVWKLTDRSVAAIQESIDAAKDKEIDALRTRLHREVPELIYWSDDASPQQLERRLGALIHDDRTGNYTQRHLEAIRYFALTNRIDAYGALLLSAYVALTNPHGTVQPALKDKITETAVGHVFGQVLNPAISVPLSMLGYGAGATASAFSAGASLVVAHLIMRQVQKRRNRSVANETYEAFRRDFYQRLADMRLGVRAGLIDAGLWDESISDAMEVIPLEGG